MRINRILLIDKSTDRVNEAVLTYKVCCARNHWFLILRIQTLDLIQRYITKVRRFVRSADFVYLHCVSTCRNISFHRADIVIAVVSHHIVGSDKGRHIATCFFRQIIVDFPIISFAIGTADCLIDCTWYHSYKQQLPGSSLHRYHTFL